MMRDVITFNAGIVAISKAEAYAYPNLDAVDYKSVVVANVNTLHYTSADFLGEAGSAKNRQFTRRFILWLTSSGLMASGK